MSSDDSNAVEGQHWLPRVIAPTPRELDRLLASADELGQCIETYEDTVAGRSFAEVVDSDRWDCFESMLAALRELGEWRTGNVWSLRDGDAKSLDVRGWPNVGAVRYACRIFALAFRTVVDELARANLCELGIAGAVEGKPGTVPLCRRAHCEDVVFPRFGLVTDETGERLYARADAEWSSPRMVLSNGACHVFAATFEPLEWGLIGQGEVRYPIDHLEEMAKRGYAFGERARVLRFDLCKHPGYRSDYDVGGLEDCYSLDVFERNVFEEVAEIERSTGAQLKDGGDPCWFVGLFNQYKAGRERFRDGLSFAAYCRRGFADQIDCDSDHSTAVNAARSGATVSGGGQVGRNEEAEDDPYLTVRLAPEELKRLFPDARVVKRGDNWLAFDDGSGRAKLGFQELPAEKALSDANGNHESVDGRGRDGEDAKRRREQIDSFVHTLAMVACWEAHAVEDDPEIRDQVRTDKSRLKKAAVDAGLCDWGTPTDEAARRVIEWGGGTSGQSDANVRRWPVDEAIERLRRNERPSEDVAGSNADASDEPDGDWSTHSFKTTVPLPILAAAVGLNGDAQTNGEGQRDAEPSTGHGKRRLEPAEIEKSGWGLLIEAKKSGTPIKSRRELAAKIGCSPSGKAVSQVWERWVGAMGTETDPKAERLRGDVEDAQAALERLTKQSEAETRADQFSRRPKA